MFDLALNFLEIYFQFENVHDNEHDKVLLDMDCSLFFFTESEMRALILS